MILAERAARLEAEAVAASAKAEAADAKAAEALISYLKLEIEKLRRQVYGSRSERKARLLEQMELELEELEATATEDELAAERAAAQTQTVKSFQRKRPSRKPFPDHLPRERVVIPGPESCPCCGSSRLSKLGEDITETLEVVPRQWKVIQTVREKFSCRDCETITQPSAPFHVTPRGFAGPNLLAMILFEKFGQHQPLNRQSERYRREGIDLSLSTLADQVSACAVALQPLHALIERHVLAAERLHGDDTNVPILAKGQTIKGHIWTYVRDDRPFGGRAPPAALFYASRDRRGEHPVRHLAGFSSILQADAYGGYNELCEASRPQGPIMPALCWAHARRQFFELADIAANARRGKNATAISPIALEAVRRIDALFDIERGIKRGERRRTATGAQGAKRAPVGRTGSLAAGAARASVKLLCGRQANRLCAPPLGSVCLLSRRWPHLPHQQCGRARVAWFCVGQKVLALRRLRARCRPGRGHGNAHHDGKAQRRRSAGLARRRARPHQRSRCPQARGTLAMELGLRDGAS
jgi:transposase